MKRAAASLLVVILLSGLFGIQTEANSDPLTYRGGIRNSTGKHRLKEKELKRMLASLAEKTGFQELSFDADGFLTIGDPHHFVNGSITARRLLMDAVDFPSQFNLENHSYSSKVVFANLGKSTLFFNMRTKAQIEHQPLRLDFTDFGKLMGAKEVLASFDLGMTILHELVHGVRKLHDSVSEWEEVGDCERYVNTMRKELGLPERQQYIARSHTMRSPMGWTMKMAELQFARTDFRNGKLKTDEFKLSWDVNRVGLGEPERVNTKITTATARKPEQKAAAAVH
jgi:hypothetical protein